MSNEKKKTTKRRTVTPARMFKQLRTFVADSGIDPSATTVDELMEQLKAAALEEMIAEM